jgi:hypothetical protein
MMYFGPYKILERIGIAAYKLELPVDSKVHPVFHVLQLKSYTTDYSLAFQPLPHPPQFDLLDLEPEMILGRRLSNCGNSAITQVLVKWSSLPKEMAIWEDFNVLKTQFSAATAWGQAASSVGGIVTPGHAGSSWSIRPWHWIRPGPAGEGLSRVQTEGEAFIRL